MPKQSLWLWAIFALLLALGACGDSAETDEHQVPFLAPASMKALAATRSKKPNDEQT
jgi:hypothetical protein